MQIQYIDTNKKLAHVIDHLQEIERFAIDLEFDKNRYKYGFNLCLMQICSASQCFLIDPLHEEIDLSPIYSILEDPKIQKVAFSFGEDLRLLDSLGCKLQNLYDTRLALNLLDYPPASLSNALEEWLGITVSKSAQMSNWFLRPLTKEQKEYAAEDVLHLLELKDLIADKITQKGRDAWVQQENEYFLKVSVHDTSEKSLLKDKEKKDMNAYDAFILEEVLQFREEIAKEFNKPNYQIVRTEALKEIVQNPYRLKNWQRMKGVYAKVKTPFYQESLEKTIQKARRQALQQGLSKEEAAIQPLSKEAYQAFKRNRSLVDEAKQKVFKPIQEAISKKLGNNMAIFMLSNKHMANLALGKTEHFPVYRIQLVNEYADQLGLDAGKYIEGVA